MAEKKGFEPPHAFTSSGFRNRPLQPLGYFSDAEQLYHRKDENRRKRKTSKEFRRYTFMKIFSQKKKYQEIFSKTFTNY